MALPEDQPGEHPFADLERLITARGWEADVLVCCGDIGDKAVPDAIAWAWNWLKRIQRALGAAHLFVTSGNHDLDSRYLYNGHDAKGTLLGLVDYPFADQALNNEYWARSAVVVSEPDFNIVVLNSAAHHGVNDEWQHGRVTPRTVNYIQERLVSMPRGRANILLCHHHLYRFGSVNLDDYSEMIDASMLLELLGSGAHGRWLVLHGHRHWPNLEYAAGGGSSPVVLAAGSFSAVLYAELQDKARNQCYLLTLPGPAALGLYNLSGTFLAWDWIGGMGWLPAKERSGLPHRGGFGNRRGGDLVAEEIAQHIDAATPVHTWDRLCQLIPDLPFLTPRDQSLCIAGLKARGLDVLDRDGQPAQVGRLT
jgi:predicted phosphodiesterase